MASQFDVDNLRDLVSRTIVSGALVDAGDHESWRNDTESRVAQLNDALQALASSNAGSGAPAKVRAGGYYFNTTDEQWVGAPDANDYDDQWLSELQAYLGDLANAGTDTFRVGGALDVDTDDVVQTEPPAVLHSYTVPANTLDSNHVFLATIGWGPTTNDSAKTVLTRYGGETLGTHVFEEATARDWIIRLIIVRTASGAQKFCSINHWSNDAASLTDKVVVGSSSVDETSAQNVDLFYSSGSFAITQDAQIVEYAP